MQTEKEEEVKGKEEGSEGGGAEMHSLAVNRGLSVVSSLQLV